MRIVAGAFRGRNLVGPQHDGLRPTSDRVREAVFSILEHGAPDVSFAGIRVLDLFAGTGALGLEALSRGAAFTLFVEESADARALIRRNVEALGLTGQTKIFRRDATSLGPAGTMAPFALAFLDPPYGQSLAERALVAAAEGGWLTPDAICVVEERADVALAAPAGFAEIDRRAWGDTAATFLRYLGTAADIASEVTR
jgi:16S rRNA (guanine966-N2)-methyltransferase